MPRVIKAVKSKRGKEVSCGRCQLAIEPGMEYLHFQKYRSQKQIRCTAHPPKQSELTGSDKLATLYGTSEGLDNDAEAFRTGGEVNDLADALDMAVEAVREVGEGYQESADAVGEYFPGSSQVEEIEEKAAQCEEWADALEQAASEVRDAEKEEGETDEDFVERVSDIVTSAIGELQL